MRTLDPNFKAALSAGLVQPVFLVTLTFRSSTQFIWTGIGDLVYNAQTYKGVGSLGKMGAITEGVGITADGTTLTLSGIDPTLYGECMTDIQPGAPAEILFGLMTSGVLIGAPYKLFVGGVDVPTATVGADTISISLTLENRLIDLSRPTVDRYTSASQRITYPTDTAFSWVESENDMALSWGQ